MYTHEYFLTHESLRVVIASTSFGMAAVGAAILLAGLLVLFAFLLAILQIRRSSCSPGKLAMLVYKTILERSIYSDRLPAMTVWQRAFRRCRDFECVLSVANEMIESTTDPHGYLERDDATDANDDARAEARLLSNTVGYLRISGFTDGISKCVERQLRQIGSIASLIIDLRGNRGGLVLESFKTASLFLRRGTLARFERRIPGSDSTSRLKYSVELSESGIVQSGAVEDSAFGEPIVLEDQVLAERLKLWRLGQLLVLVVDEGSASAAELFAGALKDNGAAVIAGRPTYGKGVGQSHVTLSGDIALNVTSFKYFTPNGFWPGDGTKPGSGLVPAIAIVADKEDSCDCSGNSLDACDKAILEVLQAIARF